MRKLICIALEWRRICAGFRWSSGLPIFMAYTLWNPTALIWCNSLSIFSAACMVLSKGFRLYFFFVREIYTTTKANQPQRKSNNNKLCVALIEKVLSLLNINNRLLKLLWASTNQKDYRRDGCFKVCLSDSNQLD